VCEGALDDIVMGELGTYCGYIGSLATECGV
jgi:hypothetical protein